MGGESGERGGEETGKRGDGEGGESGRGADVGEREVVGRGRKGRVRDGGGRKEEC